ncbi:hypothetical protein SRHO_G00073720, partial [Serrasalmus rhombeus]
MTERAPGDVTAKTDTTGHSLTHRPSPAP